MADFHETRMGHTFFEGTMPRIAAALAEIAEELKRGYDRHPVHPLETPARTGAPQEAIPPKRPLNSFQRLAAASYEDGVFKDLVSSPEDAEGLNAPLFQGILVQLSTENTRGEKERAVEKLDAMLRALQQVRDTLKSA